MSKTYEAEKQRLLRATAKERKQAASDAARRYPGLLELKHRLDKNPQARQAVKAALTRLKAQ